MKNNNDEFKLKSYLKSIKKRDNFKCCNPECKLRHLPDNNKAKKNIRLTVHHVDYDSDNISPWNLITLCLGCKVEARYNKLYSFEVYTELMQIKYYNDWPHQNMQAAIKDFKKKLGYNEL